MAKIQPNNKNTTGMATSAHKPEEVRPSIKLYLVDINIISSVFMTINEVYKELLSKIMMMLPK